MQDDYTIPVEYAALIAEQVRSMGVDDEAWLPRSGLTRQDLAQPSRLLAYVPFRRFVLTAIAAAREPALGLFVGERLVASTHGAVGAAAINSRTLGQALEIVERFSHLRTSLIVITHEVFAHEGRVFFREAQPLGDIQRPVMEAVVLSIKNVLDEISMGTCHVREVAFTFDQPEYGALANDIFGCEVRYAQSWTGICTAPDVLELPLKLSDPKAFDEAARICQRELDLLTESEHFATRVHRLLLTKQHGFPTLAVAARLLHVTPRTLHRRLVAEGTSYRALLESVRHTLAVEHVKSGHFTMDEIAYRLGYTDLANFRRAFKRWESVAPSVYREQKK